MNIFVFSAKILLKPMLYYMNTPWGSQSPKNRLKRAFMTWWSLEFLTINPGNTQQGFTIFNKKMKLLDDISQENMYF